MRKTFLMEDLDCANCAAKMEAAIRKIDGVTDASVSFILQKITVEAPDEIFDRVMKEAAKAVRRVDSDARIIF